MPEVFFFSLVGSSLEAPHSHSWMCRLTFVVMENFRTLISVFSVFVAFLGLCQATHVSYVPTLKGDMSWAVIFF